MRVGEIKNILKATLGDNRNLELKAEALYGGQAHQINNYVELMEVFEILANQNWVEVDNIKVLAIKEKYGEPKNPTILTVDEYNQFSGYVGTVNAKIPLYYSILESLTEEQPEEAINIKLPSKLDSLVDLIETNKRIDGVLKLFNVDGQFKFHGFDKGTSWLVLIGGGVLTYRFLVACLKISQEYLKTKTEYFKSEEAKLAYETSLREKEKVSEDGFERFRDRWLELFIEKEVKKAVEAVGTNGQTQPELASQLVKATTKLVQELGEGTEFHLSLNPPSYAREVGGELKIDYKKIQALSPTKKEDPKQLGEAKKKNEDEK